MFDSISPALMKDYVLEALRAKLINRSRAEFRERNSHPDPAASGQIAGYSAECQGFGERCREGSHLQSLPCGGKHDRRQVGRSNRLGGKTPNVQARSRKFRISVAEVHDPYLGLPCSVFFRSPSHTQSVGWG